MITTAKPDGRVILSPADQRKMGHMTPAEAREFVRQQNAKAREEREAADRKHAARMRQIDEDGNKARAGARSATGCSTSPADEYQRRAHTAKRTRACEQAVRDRTPEQQALVDEVLRQQREALAAGQSAAHRAAPAPRINPTSVFDARAAATSDAPRQLEDAPPKPPADPRPGSIGQVAAAYYGGCTDAGDALVPTSGRGGGR